MIKGALFDIDDTLYSHIDKNVPPLTIKALKKLKEKNIKIGVCTSRDPGEMAFFPKEFTDMFDCLITSTGAVTFIKDKYFKSYSLDKDSVNQYIDYFKKNNISYYFSDINGDICFWGDKKLVEDGFLLNACKGKVFFQEYLDEEINNLGFFNVTDKQLEDIKNINPQSYLSIWGHSGHIAPNYVDKSFGLMKFCQMFSFTTDEIIAFGDGSNDDLMLKMAGIGVATDDAKENTKQSADYVCKKSIEDGGIYDALCDLKIIEEDIYESKIFFFDNDSTLFDHSKKGKQVRDSVYLALNKLKENGYKICLNTSRGYKEMFNVPKKLLDLFDDICLLSGAYIIHDEKIDYICMDKEDVQRIIKECDEAGLTYRYATTDGGGYLNRHDTEKEQLFYQLYEMVPPIKKYENEEVLHFIVYSDDETRDKICSKLTNSSYDFLSISTELEPKNINKGTTLLRVCERYGIDPKYACAIGDSGNDISMFKVAGLSICMGNGASEAKKNADYITDKTYEDGIYNCLKHFNFVD